MKNSFKTVLLMFVIVQTSLFAGEFVEQEISVNVDQVLACGGCGGGGRDR